MGEPEEEKTLYGSVRDTPDLPCRRERRLFASPARPMGIDHITCEDFEALRGETASLESGARSLPLRVSAVQRLGRNGPQARESFSVLFHAPADARLPQRIYPVRHPALGELELFLVPLGPDAQGLQLEAIFNFA